MTEEPDRINPLFKYQQDMTPEELDERIKEIRTERRSYRKKASKVKKESVKLSEKAKALMASMSEEDMAALLKDLEE